MAEISGHAGQQAVAAIAAYGTDVMFTLNGGHIWPFYDAARDQGCLLYTSPSPRDGLLSRMPSSA